MIMMPKSNQINQSYLHQLTAVGQISTSRRPAAWLMMTTLVSHQPKI